LSMRSLVYFQDMRLLLIVLLCLSLAGTGYSAKQPGVITVINEQFFESETRKLFDDLEKELLEMDGVNVRGQDGRLSWELKRLGVYHFEGPKTEVEISSRNDKAVFTLEMVDAALKTSFDWAASYDLWLTDIRISGKANAKLLDLDMTKSVALGISESGKLELDSRNCQLSSCCHLEIEDMDISVYGGVVAWIIDKTISWWEDEIIEMIRDEACSRIDDVIHSELNRALESFPATTDLVHEDLHLNYTLLHLDTVGDCLVVGVDGGVTPAPREGEDIQPCKTDVTDNGDLLGVGGHTPLPASECVAEDYDFSTKISQSTIQSLVDSVFQAGLLGSFNLDQETIQRVKIFQPGFFARGGDPLLQHYPLSIDVNITGSPSTSINTNLSCIDMEIPTRLEVVMLHPNKRKDKKLLLTLDTVFLVGVQFQVTKEFVTEEDGEEGTRVKLQGKIIRTNSTLQNTTMNEEYELDGDLELTSVSTLLRMIRASLIQPPVYKHLENGIPTNFGDVFDIEVTRFRYFENYVEFDGTIEDWAVDK